MKTNGADLILLDLLLGAGMDGTATYDQIRRIRPFQRVIVLSGYATPDQVAALRRIGVEHYLIKPVPRLMLAQTIRTELSRP
jgi:DNA-binding NarL/FixJ family response regulator